MSENGGLVEIARNNVRNDLALVIGEARRWGEITDREAADAAIHWLWEQVDSYEFSDAFQEFLQTMSQDPEEVVNGALTYLLGPKPEEDNQ